MRQPTALISVAALLWLAGCASASAQDFSLTIDGKQQNVPGSVSCSAHAGGEAIEIGNLPSGVYVHVSPDNSSIDSIDLGNSTGKSLTAHGAKVSHGPNGMYDITGDAVPEDTTDSGPPKPFELKVKCP